MSTELKTVLIEGYDESKVAMQEQEYNQAWAQIYGARQNNLILQSTMTGIENRLNKACAIINVGDIRGYIPIDFFGTDDMQEMRRLIGQQIAFKIVEYDREGNTFIGSRTSALEHMASITWSRLELDAIVTSVIRRVDRKSIRVDIGGIMVTIPVEEMGYGWFDDLRDNFNVGDHIQVKVVELNKGAVNDADKKEESAETETSNEGDEDEMGVSANSSEPYVKLSRKALEENPWPDCTKRYVKSGQYVGTVSGVAEYGVFVRLERGVDALVRHMRFNKVKKGQRVLVRVGNIDVKKHYIYGVIIRAL